MYKFLAGAALIAMTATAAQAQTEWTGGYMGIQAGGYFTPDNDDETLVFDRDGDGTFDDTVTMGGGGDFFAPGYCPGAATSASNTNCVGDNGGLDAGWRGGYDMQRGRIVYGIVGELTAANVSDSVSGFTSAPDSYTMTRDAQFLIGIRGRGGVLFGENLAYLTGGYALGEVDHAFSTSNETNGFAYEVDNDLDGFQLGAGVERRIGGSPWHLGLEYLYTSLDDEFTVNIAPGDAPATNPFILPPNTSGTDIGRSEEDFRFSSVRATASYRF